MSPQAPGDTVTPDDFRAALEEFGLSYRDCARFLDVDVRNVSRWATGDRDAEAPRSVELLFAVMRHQGLTVSQVEDML